MSPKPRSCLPLTGFGNSPRALAKATAGASRPALPSEVGAVLPEALLSADFAASAEARAAAAFSFSIRAIRSRRLVACAASSADRRCSSASASLRARLLIAFFLKQELNPRALLGERRGIGPQAVHLSRLLFFQGNQFAKIGGHLVGGVPQVGNHGAEQHGAADRGERVFWSHHHRRRRPVAHPLKRGEHLGEHVPALEERGMQGRLVGGERLDPALGQVDRRLEVLDPLAGVDQGLVERRPVLVERVDLLAEFRLALLRQVDVAGDRVELRFARLLGGVRRVGRGRQGTGAKEGRQANGEHQEAYPSEHGIDQICGPGAESIMRHGRP